jgi:hypothetical protein
VKDIRKMIGKMIWDAREEAAYLERSNRPGMLTRRRERCGSNCSFYKRQELTIVLVKRSNYIVKLTKCFSV